MGASHKALPPLVLTCGEPAGIGAELAVKARAILGSVAISAPAPVAAMRPRRAAPKAPPKSPATGSWTEQSSAVAMSFSQ